jgi:hypothetical protein
VPVLEVYYVLRIRKSKRGQAAEHAPRVKEKPITREIALRSLQNREPVNQTVKPMHSGESDLDMRLKLMEKIIAEMEMDKRRCRFFK